MERKKSFLVILLLFLTLAITAKADGYMVKRIVDGTPVYIMADAGDDFSGNTAFFFQIEGKTVLVWNEPDTNPVRITIIFDDVRYSDKLVQSNIDKTNLNNKLSKIYAIEIDDLPTNLDFEHFGGGAIGFILKDGSTRIYQYLFDKED